MPRVKPYRFLRLLCYVWLLTIAIWSLLPSPTISYAQEALHNERTLKTSQTLTVVDNYPKIFGKSSGSDGTGHFIFPWQVSRRLNSQDQVELTLKLGENAPINLASLMRKSESFHFSKTKDDVVRTPFFDPLRLDFEVPWVENIEESICLPWFDLSDKALLTHDLHGGKSSISLRLIVDEHGIVEVWPASFVESALAELGKVRQNPEAAEYEEGEFMEQTLLFLRELGHPIIQLEGGDMTNLEEISVPYVRGNLPSKSYHIRKALLAHLDLTLRITLFPLFLVVRSLSIVPQFLLLILLQGWLACAGITLSAWLRAGRPKFQQWARTFWITRWIPFRTNKAKRVWGPTGPVELKRAEHNEWTASGIVGVQRPKTVRLGRGFDAV